MTARDDLAAVIGSKLDGIFGTRDFGPATQDFKLADELIAAGYSKPRTITTTEEVDALPKKAVVMTAFGDALTIYRSPRIPVGHYHFLVADGLTATVLHEGPDDA
jgi:hypothetical protein